MKPLGICLTTLALLAAGYDATTSAAQTATPASTGAALPADNDIANFGQALIPDVLADPSIVGLDGTFYCYATTDGWGQGLSVSGTPVY